MRKIIITYSPILGISTFLLLFVYASTLYPGGSQADSTSVGYDWINNYWCNLMNENAINGDENPARPIAITAMIILCASFVVFFYQLSERFAKEVIWKRAIKIGGILSMLSAMFILSDYHDSMTIASSFFGLFAVVGIAVELYKSNMHVYKIATLGCFLLLLINNIIYYSGVNLEYLPLLQKVTFIAIFVWVIGLHLKVTFNTIE